MIATSIRIAAIIATVLIAERLLRRGDAQSRYRLLVIALLSVFIPPLFRAPWFDRAAIATEAIAPREIPLLPSIYVAGVIFCTIRYALELRALARMRRRCEARGEVLISPDNIGPLTAGIFRPIIVVPQRAIETLGDDDLRIIVAHERIHLERHHVVVAHIARIAHIVWWFNPLVSMLVAAERRVREEVCDELVVSRGDIARDTYCETLLRASAADLGQPLQLAAAFAQPHPLASRLTRIMSGGSQRRRATALLTFAIAIAAIVTQLGAAPPLSTPDLSPEDEKRIDAIDYVADDSPSPSPSPSPSHSP
jgi:hypothetical protein